MLMIYDCSVCKHMKQSERISFYECGIEYCVPGHSHGPKVRPKTVIHVVKEGKGKLYVGDKVFDVKENQAFLVSANLNVYYEADRKINYASYLLEETDRSVQEIAFMCGFNSLPSFGKIFKKIRSVSPGEYRKLCASKKMSLSYWNNIASYEK